MAHPPLSGETASLVAWLHQKALIGATVEAILQGLCGQALAMGLDLDRAVVAYLVFHPQFDGMTFTWTRDTGRAVRQAATQPDIRRLPSPFLHMQTTGTEELRYRLDEGGEPLPFPLLDHLRSFGFTDYLAFFRPFGSSADPTLWPDLPPGTVMRAGVTGSFSTKRSGGFTKCELDVLRALVLPYAVAVKAAATFEMAEILLGTYLGAATGRSVLRGHVQRGHGHRVHAVILYSDMRDSTALAAGSSLETYLATLNAYFDCVVDAIDAQGGEVLKFTGDGVLAMFPFEEGTQAGTKACWLALAAARDALDQLGNVNAGRAAAEESEIRCGIALHAGDVMYGNVGSARRLDFTATGPAVNEVCRLEAQCKTLAVPLILSDVAASLHAGPLLSLGWHELRGVGRAIEAFSLPEHRI
ncbi:adenylate/guanylate cyclase domain-containing protein [Microvirga tunisiensis]|uniref:Adenylate/guanylate cyclase domain-containing protein n=1 Tax=Microvirga tunisiensis TaxID=2108360 RepID=A0A5N7MTF6_9HYPH|nr:adenylate/guanylate cyclase domain-containing protein [Microvirga tunisiensis]MPR12328.1 adenylate/guanylate cyclase domain-containing protein [Microvirga tunisiensis]MPR30253.1 adenylate/guanylate cyclase domain-containing protein [Microvirga tunisiensis]